MKPFDIYNSKVLHTSTDLYPTHKFFKVDPETNAIVFDE